MTFYFYILQDGLQRMGVFLHFCIFGRKLCQFCGAWRRETRGGKRTARYPCKKRFVPWGEDRNASADAPSPHGRGGRFDGFCTFFDGRCLFFSPVPCYHRGSSRPAVGAAALRGEKAAGWHGGRVLRIFCGGGKAPQARFPPSENRRSRHRMRRNGLDGAFFCLFARAGCAAGFLLLALLRRRPARDCRGRARGCRAADALCGRGDGRGGCGAAPDFPAVRGSLRLRFYLPDEGHDEAAVREEYLSSPDGVVYLRLKNLDTYLVTVEPM